jgi:hypothetical protein
MKILIKAQILVTLIIGLTLMATTTPQRAISFIIGSITILISVFLMGIGFKFIFSKKLIALAIGIIVFKYAILGIIIYKLVNSQWLNPMWFILGVASLSLSGLYYATKEALRKG